MKRFALLLICLILATAACQSNDTPEISAEEIILNAANRMTETAGFRFRIAQDGAFVYVDRLLIKRPLPSKSSLPALSPT